MGKTRNPNEPDLGVASRKARLALDPDGRGARREDDGSTHPSPPADTPQQGNEGSLPQSPGAPDTDDTAPAGKVYHMRRILARVDQVRLATRSLAAVVAEAEEAGYDRDVILEAVHRGVTAEDWPLQYQRLAAAAELLQACGSPVDMALLRLDERPVSSLEARKEAAEVDGFHAEVVGRAIDACPYSSDQKALRAAWRRGWNLARSGGSIIKKGPAPQRASPEGEE